MFPQHIMVVEVVLDGRRHSHHSLARVVSLLLLSFYARFRRFSHHPLMVFLNLFTR